MCVRAFIFKFGSVSSKHIDVLQQKYSGAKTRHNHLAIRFNIKFKRFQKFAIFGRNSVPRNLFSTLCPCSFLSLFIYRHHCLLRGLYTFIWYSVIAIGNRMHRDHEIVKKEHS